MARRGAEGSGAGGARASGAPGGPGPLGALSVLSRCSCPAADTESAPLPVRLRHPQPAETCLSHRVCTLCSSSLPFRASPHLLFIPQTLSARLHLQFSSSSLPSSSPFPFRSRPVPFTLSLSHAFPCHRAPLLRAPPSRVAVSLLSPTPLPLWHPVLLSGKFLESVPSDATQGFLCYRAT